MTETKFIAQLHNSVQYARGVKNLIRDCVKDVRENMLGQKFPILPRVLNLLVNDICNSHCQMCFIWQRKRDKEVTLDELENILGDPLFSKLQYVGVSGGEPTLRSDLPDIYRILVLKRPKILGTGIITNAIQNETVINRILPSAQVCKDEGVGFNVMVSLDGIGELHDHIRGVKGNFDNAIKVIRYFRDQTDIPVLIGCTITKDNVWFVDEVLDFCRSEKVYGRFRVAEFINRLYNLSAVDLIRNFDEQEAYHLGLFFAKLEYTYEQDSTIRRSYRNIRKMLLEGSKRSISCPWQSTAVTLDCRGQLLYCAPKSPVLGNGLNRKGLDLYKKNISIRKEIIKHNCGECIHDYHAQKTISEWRDDLGEMLWRKRLSLNYALSRSLKGKKNSTSGNNNIASFSHVLIIGWYGTETAGDKAIFAEIVHEIQKRSPRARITVASLYPYVTQQTIKEFSFHEIRIIPTFSKHFWDCSAGADEVVMGGGPLMHLEELGLVLTAFVRAKSRGHHTWIAGCGIGPLEKGEKYWSAVQMILSFADEIELRDSASVDIAHRMINRNDIKQSSDMAVRYVQRWKVSSTTPTRQPILNLFLRDWTQEYQGKLSTEEFIATKARFEEELGQWIWEICTKTGLRPRLIPMHHFCVGNDDRDFNRHFADRHLKDLEPIIEFKPISVSEILYSIKEATASLCMRFHSLLFTHTLDMPYWAIDYTNGGKLYCFLKDQNMLSSVLTLQEIAEGRLRDSVNQFLT